MKTLFRLLPIVLLAWVTNPVAAQTETDSAAAQAIAEARESLVPHMERLDQGIAELERLTAQIKSEGDSVSEALLFRRDTLSVKLLSHFENLLREAAKVPDGDPLREKAENRIGEDLASAAAVVFIRIEEVGQRIAKFSAELGSLSGNKRVTTQAYVNALETIRLQYFDALVAIIEGHDALGLPPGELKENLNQLLFAHAENIAGLAEFSGTALQEVQGRLAQNPADADLQATVHALTTDQALLLQRLETIVALLERLGLDSSSYKEILLTQSDFLSLNVLEGGVVLDLLRDSWNSTRESLVSNAPDVVLRLLVFALILFAFRVLSRLVRKGVKAACERSQADMSTLLKNVLVSISGGTVMAIGILMALSQIGISLGPMLAGLGVAGFVVGFALQDSLANFAAGGMILIYRPYDVDDFVEVAGASGLVKKMSLVSTTINTFDNQTLVVPNNKIWGDVIKNVTAQKVRRVDMEFGIGYSDDIELTETVLHDIVSKHEKTLDKPEPMIKLNTLGDSSVNFVVRPWVKTDDYWDVYFDITREVKMRFDREGISIPFPQRDVHVFQEQG